MSVIFASSTWNLDKPACLYASLVLEKGSILHEI